MQRLQLPSGSTDCRLLNDGRGPSLVPAVFDDVPPAELAGALASDPQGPDGPYNCLLIQAPDGLVLVDTGLGSLEHPLGGAGGGLWEELEHAEVAPADVAVVVVTHGHPDHIGGLVAGDGQPAFARARYLMPEGEWAFWTSSANMATMSEPVAAAARAQLLPLGAAGVVETFSGEVEIAAGVHLLPAPGHTPAHVAVEVGSEGGLLFAVDALLHPLQVERPDWGGGLDRDTEAAVAARRSLLARAEERGHLLAATHWDGVVEPPRQTGGKPVWSALAPP